MGKNSQNPQKIYGVLGYPARHSLSPAMHNAAFAHLKINAEYKIFEEPSGELAEFLRSLIKQNIHGLNVTIPYKEKVMPYLDKISDEAILIGAVNTIKVNNHKLEGFNTDGQGFLKHLRKDLGLACLKDKVIAIIGAGGAARAIAVTLSKENPASINIYDIDQARASMLIENLKQHFGNIKFAVARCIEELIQNNCQLLINASPIGMKPADSCLVEERFIRQETLVYDVIYNPPETKLLKLAKQKGCRTANGLGMLLYQGALAFQLWTDEIAPVAVMKNALEQALNKTH